MPASVQREFEQARLGFLQRQFSNRTRPEHAGRDRLRQIGQRGLGLLGIGGIANADLNRVPAAAKAGIADLGVAQLGADLVARRVEALVDDVLPDDLEQDVRSALQVEAERHLLFGQPVRPGGEHVLRDQIGGGEDDGHRHGKPNANRLPA